MKSEYEKLEINTLALLQLGYRPLIGYSRYMIKRGDVMSVIRMRKIKVRPDGRFNLIKDSGKRSPVNVQALVKYVEKQL